MAETIIQMIERYHGSCFSIDVGGEDDWICATPTPGGPCLSEIIVQPHRVNMCDAGELKHT